MTKRWTPEEDAILREVAAARKSKAVAALVLGRTYYSIKHRSASMGIRFSPLIWERPERNPDVRTWTATDRIAAWADVPQGLAELLFREAWERNIDVPTVRSDLKHGHLVAARREIALEAREQGYSYPMIGRALNRDHTSVRHLVVTA